MTYQPLTVEQLNTLEIPPVDWLIDNVLPRAAFVGLVAREKSGKSLMLIDQLVSIAAGEPFMDQSVIQGPTALIAMEDSLRDVRARLNLRLNGLNEVPVYLLPCDGSIPDIRFSLEDTESLTNLAGMIDEYQLAAVGIDTLRETHNLAENESDAMAPLLRGIRQIAHEKNCTITMCHHSSKAGGSRGSTAIAAAFDQILYWKLTDPESDQLSGTLRIEGRYGPRTSIRATYGQHGRWAIDTSVIIPTNTRERIATFLETAGGWHSPESIETGLADNMVKLKTVQNTLGELVRSGDVIRRGTGKRGNPFTYAVMGNSHLFPEGPGSNQDLTSVYSPRPKPPRESSGGINDHSAKIPQNGLVCLGCGQPRSKGMPCLKCGLSVAEARVAVNEVAF
ncbi:hypothetical protein BH23CHL5_BH23CHL5_28340 [soil metagenome]